MGSTMVVRDNSGKTKPGPLVTRVWRLLSMKKGLEIGISWLKTGAVISRKLSKNSG